MNALKRLLRRLKRLLNSMFDCTSRFLCHMFFCTRGKHEWHSRPFHGEPGTGRFKQYRNCPAIRPVRTRNRKQP